MSVLYEQKSALRSQVRAVVLQLSPAARAEAAAQVCSRLLDRIEWASACSILSYAPLPDELDIWPLVAAGLANGKQVSLPRYSPLTQNYTAARVHDLGNDLCRGQMGIREPLARCEEFPLNRLDLVLVPGVAFDPHGRRLGRGKGFYDRLLANVQGRKCGVAFDEQVVTEVPVGPRDIVLNCILTPTRWLGC